MEIRKRFAGNIAIFYIAGNIDIDSAELIEETGRLLKEGIDKILWNFANVDVVDYNGLSILTIAFKNTLNQNGTLKFCDVPNHIRELFKAARLDNVFEIYSDEEVALASFALTTRVDTLQLRRRFKRIDVGIPVRYKVGLSAAMKLATGKVLNMSGEGMFIYSKATFPISTELYIELEIPGTKETIVLDGIVIWLADQELQPHSYPGMGVTFTNLNKRTQEKIISFIDKNITQRSRG